MEQHDYAAELPQEPPAGLIPWLQGQGKLREHMIWYKAAWVCDPLTGQRKRMAELRCSACGGTMYAERIPNPGHTFGYFHPGTGHPVSDGNHVRCPMCGCEAEARHIGRGRGGKTRKELLAPDHHPHRGQAGPGGLVRGEVHLLRGKREHFLSAV